MLHSIMQTLVNQVYIRILSFDWHSQLYSEWRQTPKLVNFQDFCLGPGIRSMSKFDND